MALLSNLDFKLYVRAIIGHEKPNEIKLESVGNGGAEEIKASLKEDEVQYVLCRLFVCVFV